MKVSRWMPAILLALACAFPVLATDPPPVDEKAMMEAKEKITFKDKDHHTMEMWMPSPDGKLFLSMQIDYARAN